VSEITETKLDVTGPQLPKGAVVSSKGTISTPVTNVPAPSIASRVNVAAGNTVPRPKGLTVGNTRELNKSFFRSVLYAETNARKTSTAALFDTPEYVRIILTRRPEQLIPLMRQGYQYVHCEDAASLLYALKYPEQVWPDWASMADPEGRRTIILDDGTKGVAMLVEHNNTGKDRRQAYTGALDDLDGAIVSLSRKPYNFVIIALAKVKENAITNEEQIGPDLPPSMLNYITAEFEAVLFIKTANYKMLTERDRFAYVDTDAVTGKEKTFTRIIFAKSKVPLGSTAVKKEEELNLRSYWQKVKASKEMETQVKK
jgi:hypothetical protein